MTPVHAPPHPLLLWTEWRAAGESLLAPAAAPWLAGASTGDGHPVLVLPGLLAGDGYTLPLRTFLGARGWAAYGWGQGVNFGSWKLPAENLAPVLLALSDRHGTKVSLVGPSMGGLFARWLATRFPDRVRCVVTMGSNVGGPPRANHVWPLYETMTGQDATTLSHPPPPVPSTSVYSRLDGMTDWKCCLQDQGPQRENIEVVASHHGMSHHPATMFLVADRLAQPIGDWRPFEPPAPVAAWYPSVTNRAAQVGAGCSGQDARGRTALRCR